MAVGASVIRDQIDLALLAVDKKENARDSTPEAKLPAVQSWFRPQLHAKHFPITRSFQLKING